MPLLVTTFFVAMITLLGALYIPQQEARRTIAVANVGATSLLAYRQAVIDYLSVNPTFTGTVANAALTFPWGYVPDLRWTNLVSNGTLFVYSVAPNTSLMIETLYRMTARSFMLGRNVAGTLVSQNGFSTGIAVPVAIPNGAFVFVGK